MRKLILMAVAIFAVATSQAQVKVGDATLPETMSVAGQELILNGSGLREKVFIDLYAAGLYLTEKNTKAQKIVDADENMAMKLDIVSILISSDNLTESVNEGFDASMDGDTSSLDSEIKTFLGFFSDKIVKGTVFDLVYVKEKGTTVYRNGEEKGTIAGLDFKKALWGIWLGYFPADKDLKKGLLGK